MTAPVETAVSLAARGFRVFTLHGIRSDGSCTCDKSDCDRAGKHPRFAGWQKAATDNETIARLIFAGWHVTNIGIATGHGLVVVDCDDAVAEQRFVDEFQPPATYCVRTRKGTHFYFRHDPSIRLRTMTAWRPGVDIRAESGLVVAAGSRHASGFVYASCDDPPNPVAQAPEALLEALPRQYAHGSSYVSDRVRASCEIPGADRVIETLFLAPARALPSGERNSQLFRLACQLYDHIWTGLYFEGRLDDLAKAAKDSGLTEIEVRRTIESAKRRVTADRTGQG